MAFSGEFLTWAIGFFILSILAAAAGTISKTHLSMDLARIFTIIFLILAVIALIL